MKAQSLKNAILQLAVQGKLVPQNNSDEPASELLKKIKSEKAKLLEEKKIKAEKPLASINDEEKPFDIPASWEWVRLGKLLHIARGGSPRPIDSFITDANDGINWIKISDSDIGGKYINSTKQKIKLAGVAKSRYVSAGDFLLTNSMSYGRPYIMNTDGCIHDGWLVLSGSNIAFNKDFLYYLLSSSFVFNQFASIVSGGVVKNLNSDKAALTVIPLPPLAEQQRIVEKIEQLMPLVEQYDSYEKELSALEAKFPSDLKKSILQFAVQGKLVSQNSTDEPASQLLKKIKAEKAKLIKEKKIRAEKPLAPITDEKKPFDIPDSWEWVRLVDIGSWGSGATPSRTNSAYYNGIIPWLKTGDLTDGYIYEIPECISELALEKTSLRLNNADSVLMAMYGATIGKVGILTFPATTNQACCACSVFNGIHNKYLFYFLLSQRDNFKNMSEGGAQPNISKEKILKYLFPLPPLAEQKRIVQKVEQILALCDVLADENKLKKHQSPKRLAKVVDFTPVQTEEEHEHLFAARADEVSPETRSKEQERLALLRKKK